MYSAFLTKVNSKALIREYTPKTKPELYQLTMKQLVNGVNILTGLNMKKFATKDHAICRINEAMKKATSAQIIESGLCNMREGTPEDLGY